VVVTFQHDSDSYSFEVSLRDIATKDDTQETLRAKILAQCETYRQRLKCKDQAMKEAGAFHATYGVDRHEIQVDSVSITPKELVWAIEMKQRRGVIRFRLTPMQFLDFISHDPPGLSLEGMDLIEQQTEATARQWLDDEQLPTAAIQGFLQRLEVEEEPVDLTPYFVQGILRIPLATGS